MGTQRGSLIESCLPRILRTFEKWECVRNPYKGQPGRKKSFTHQDMDQLKHIIKEKVDWYLDEILIKMENRTNKHFSISSLWRSMKYCSISHKK
ncbi:7927_t:CDS:2, partial [Cetraspora pellucida]